MLTADQLAEIEKRAEATSPAPWVYNSYNGIFSGPMVQAYEDWSQAVPEGHTLERRGDCPVCGEWKEPRYAPSPGWGHGCQLFDEDYRRDPEVAAVPSHHGDTATGKRAADAEFIAAARTDIPLLLETIEALTSDRDGYKALFERYDAQAFEDLIKERHQALAEVERMRGEAAETDRALMQVIAERDERQDVADALAEAIARLTGVEIGEHSSANDPWRNALDAAAEAKQLRVQASNYAYQRDTARQERDQAGAAGFAEAVAMLRDDSRYQDWWTSLPKDHPAYGYWQNPARKHMADYLETIKLPLPGARPETSVEPCPAVSPLRSIQCSFPSGHGLLDGADDKLWDHGNRDRDAWWTGNGPRAGITDQIVLSDADYEAALQAGEIHERPSALPDTTED